MNAKRSFFTETAPVLAAGADEDLVDYRDRAVVPDVKQQDLMKG